MAHQYLIPKEKFFLRNERNRQYFKAMGVEDRGRGPVPYIRWSPYFAGAMGFPTVKQARAMRRKLLDAGFPCVILTVDHGRAI